MRDRPGEVGTDIVVTPSRPDTSPNPCDMAVQDGAYRLVEDDATFLALQGRFLALDGGTGPDRRLMIFDLASRGRLVDVPYDDVRFQASRVGFVYWRLGREVHSGRCLAAYGKRNGLIHQAAGHVLHEALFSIGEAAAHDTGKTGCIVTQADLK